MGVSVDIIGVHWRMDIPFICEFKISRDFWLVKEEIETRFDNKLMNMVHPEDRNLDLFHSVFRLLGKMDITM